MDAFAVQLLRECQNMHNNVFCALLHRRQNSRVGWRVVFNAWMCLVVHPDRFLRVSNQNTRTGWLVQSISMASACRL